MIGFGFSIIAVAVLVFTLVDVIRCEPWRIVFLDKVAWVFIVMLIPFIGAILWFTIGKERGSSVAPPRPAPAARPEPIRDEDIDAQVEREIEFHENEARIRRLEAELKAKHDKDKND